MHKPDRLHYPLWKSSKNGHTRLTRRAIRRYWIHARDVLHFTDPEIRKALKNHAYKVDLDIVETEMKGSNHAPK